ncbi:N-6 DNA methylase [Candidatus Peregrinibacteria bacterium]|nr:N-6 DNA methylase [Candidatus Peregrinibacteria bacterium]
MDSNTAKGLIKGTFNFPFEESRFRNFAINLLNTLDEEKSFGYISGNYIKDKFKPHITKYRRLGTYTDPMDAKIDVLVVQIKKEWALERSRSTLRNFTADYLSGRDSKDAALVAYFSKDPDDWRFSYIRMEYKLETNVSGRVTVRKDITSARRFSFLVGKNEPNHTAQAQLLPILENDRNNPTLGSLEAAFSVDAVSKEFYLDYRDLFERIHIELDGIASADSKIAKEFRSKSIDTANFAKKLMGQIVFLYFLQKKGWLGVGRDDKRNFKNWGTGPKNFLQRLFKKEFVDYSNFFNDILEPLFYEALASEHDNDYYSPLDCKIPFLNGGLFEPLKDYNWSETDIWIDNELMADVFNTFDQYNFTVREDEPLEKEVAIDPEMLGKVFENLLPENIRKGKGAYYTPRTIVHYMCQESLINYLDTEVNKQSESFQEIGKTQLDLVGNKAVKKHLKLQLEHKVKPCVPKTDIEALIREGDTILELETAIHEEGTKYPSVLMDSIKDNARTLDDALSNIKVCDPAIGSGAFPVGMLNEIVKARKVLELYLEKKETTYTLKRHCIQESIYGVDLDPGAIDIAKLRLWLSLVVDENDYSHIQTLPNLEYKIMQGNSLIEEFHGISLNIEKKSEQLDAFSGSSALSDLDELIEGLHTKQADFFNAEHPNDKKNKRECVEEAIFNIFHHELEKKKSLSPHETNEIETELKEMTHGNKVRNFFPWKLYFADVFRDNGGFDVVIANPPYIKEYTDRHAFDGLHVSPYYQGKMDIWYLFACNSIDILKKDAVLSFIATNNWVTNFGASKMRNKVINNTQVLKLIDFNNYKIFDSAGIQTMIMMFQRKNDIDDYTFDFRKLNENAIDYSDVMDVLQSKQTDNNSLFSPSIIKSKYTDKSLIFNNPVVESILQKIEKLNSFYLNESEVAQGVVFPQDFLNRKNSKILGGKYAVGDGIFALNTSELHHLRLTKTEKTLIKPYYTTGELIRYSGDSKNKYWIIYTSSKFKNPKKMKPYPNIKNHLDKYVPIISSDNKPYGLHRSRNKEFFTGEKIISLRKCSTRPSFTYTDFDCYVSATFYVIKTVKTNQLFLTAYLNSTVCAFLLRNRGKMQGNNFQVDKEPLLNIPIPDISGELQNRIIKLVDHIITSKQVNTQADTTSREIKIDEILYGLYGLTNEEVVIVEASINKK